jgi:hypothetical protein
MQVVYIFDLRDNRGLMAALIADSGYNLDLDRSTTVVQEGN